MLRVESSSLLLARREGEIEEGKNEEEFISGHVSSQQEEKEEGKSSIEALMCVPDEWLRRVFKAKEHAIFYRESSTQSSSVPYLASSEKRG